MEAARERRSPYWTLPEAGVSLGYKIYWGFNGRAVTIDIIMSLCSYVRIPLFLRLCIMPLNALEPIALSRQPCMVMLIYTTLAEAPCVIQSTWTCQLHRLSLFPTFHSNHRLLGSAGYKYIPVPRAGYYRACPAKCRNVPS